MKIMYVLQRKHNSGKTSTLNEIRKLIIENYSCCDEKVIYKSKRKSKDIITVITLTNGTKVGINSAGDDFACIKKNAMFKQEGCDIIFCACTTSSRTLVEYLDSDIFCNDYATFYIHKPKTLTDHQKCEQDEENRKTAENLVK